MRKEDVNSIICLWEYQEPKSPDPDEKAWQFVETIPLDADGYLLQKTKSIPEESVVEPIWNDWLYAWIDGVRYRRVGRAVTGFDFETGVYLLGINLPLLVSPGGSLLISVLDENFEHKGILKQPNWAKILRGGSQLSGKTANEARKVFIHESA